MAISFGCATMAFGPCTPESQPTEHPTTKAIIENYYGLGSSGLTGYVDSPRYPIPIDVTRSEVTFHAIVLAPPVSASGPQVFGNLHTRFYGSRGPAFGAPPTQWNTWSPGLPELSTSWNYDPAYPDNLVARPSGNYYAGLDGAADKKDYLYIGQKIIYPGVPDFTAIGRATLPWMFSGQSTNVIGGAASAYPGEVVWVQAAAPGLPAPVTYSWAIDGVAVPWVGGFQTTTFSAAQTGSREFTVLMTGANGSQSELSWAVWVMCLPPAAPFADDCNEP